MKRIITLLSLFLVIITNSTYADSSIIEELDGLSKTLFKDIEFLEGHVVDVKEDQIYINLGDKENLFIGQRFKVVREGELLKDPITQMILGKLEREIGELEVSQVKEGFSIAKASRVDSKVRIERGDKIVLKDRLKRTGFILFNSSEGFDLLSERIQNYFNDYLDSDDRFEVVGSKRIDKVLERIGIKENIDPGQITFLMGELNLDLLLLVDISEGKNSIFVYSQLYSRKNKNPNKEEIITLPKDDKLLQYYKSKERIEEFSLLYKSDLLEIISQSIAVGNIDDDKDVEIILNTKDSLKVFNYKDEELVESNLVDTYQLTEYDDYELLVGDNDQDGVAELFAENFNYLFKFNWTKKGYKAKAFENLYRNRPKGLVKLKEKDYLITRDYRNQLRFNLWEEGSYKTDFKLDIKANEGYRVAIGNIDDDKEVEMIVTAYDGKGKNRMKVYDLDGNFEYTFPGKYGANIGIFRDKKEILFHTTIAKENQLLSFMWDGEEYGSKWKSESFAGEIKDFVIDDINNDGKEELLVLVSEENQSRIYIYQRNLE
ncbi:hypothetical protein U472_10950 [Orenia metallireducens]|uniref:Flagellar assembly protein T C-terminal domain-containing protein n=1 Tax=Orenia metallireducens TaxID=1413210 RepID=A0A1C0A8D1_9FIRM|nr:FlgT C-terminal domain-containing protein [Orenia metallireducens]OCL26506.1 hypothetical protein U472_10950 [Orenia metallireducens]